MSRFNAIMMGATTCALAAFPCAALLALVWRFPVFMGGFQSGPKAVSPALFSVVFYGVLGGFPLLALFGGIVGAIAHTNRAPEDGAITRCVLLCSFLIALFVTGCMTLAK